ncbi:MAG: DUF3014 domain-containing protein [Candidatus Aminicenantes bacterium]
MQENKRIMVAGIVFLLVVAVGVAVYFLFFHKGKEAPSVQEISEQPAQVALEEPGEEKKEQIKEFSEVDLDQSDPLVREMAQELSSHSKLADWLTTEDIISNFTAAVDNIAHGLSPKPQIDFFSLSRDFEVVEKNGRYYLDPASYHRYDAVADVFLSVDTERCVRLYRQFKPLIQEAYRDLGYPEKDFRETLYRAIVELLRVPVVEEDIQLRKKVVTYMMADPRLENLSKAQKHLLRMGPENVRIIQEKLREMAEALGIPEDRLPGTETY